MTLHPWSTAPQCAPSCVQAVGFPSAWSSQGVGGWVVASSRSSVWVTVCLRLRPGFSTAFDIEEVLSGTGGDQLHAMVADVSKSFDNVDKSILDCALGRLVS